MDASEAAAAIERFMRGKGLRDFRTDEMCRSAVYYQFAIIGEAVAQLRQRDPTTAARISESRRIAGFRSQIIHGYGSDEITWRIIERKLPILLQELEALLKE